MLSSTLVQLIVDNWGEITSRLIRDVHHNPQLRHLAKRPEVELHEWCQAILKGLDSSLTARADEVWRHFESAGRLRFEENIPLDEAVLCGQLLKERIFRFIRDQAVRRTALELYAEQELEHRVGRFFDSMVYHTVCGYEAAERVAVQVASAARG